MRFLVSFILLLQFSSLLALPEGLVYQHVKTEEPLSYHVLIIDPKKFTMRPVAALDSAIGRESLPSMIKRHGAIGGINGGFFRIGGKHDGLPMGILKIGGKWFSTPHKPRGVIGWNEKDHKILIDRLLTKVTFSLGKQKIQVEGINRTLKSDPVLYLPSFHRHTLTERESPEWVISHGTLKKVRDKGSSIIPRRGYVVSFPIDYKGVLSFSKGTKASFDVKVVPQTHFTKSSNWAKKEHIVGGTPVLIRNGKVVRGFSKEKTIESFLIKKHARTAIGILENGHLLFFVVDGKREGVSLGMTMDELACKMKELGCIKALNLDGGGSSTFVLEGEIKNSPHGDEDEDEGQDKVRRLSDAILIFPKG